MPINWKQNQPIVVYARLVLAENFPFFMSLGYSPHWSGMGGYVDQTTKSGKESAHAEGRAIDIYLRAVKPWEKELGDGLFDLFRRNHVVLGVDHVIWNKNIWSLKGLRPYENKDNGPHTDHVHVAFTREGSQKQPILLKTLAQQLRQDLDFKHANSGIRQIEGLPNMSAEELSPYQARMSWGTTTKKFLKTTMSEYNTSLV
jgi:hypothetical protein